jgi:uncharacterized protein YjbI with pentapeptide repeats
LWITFVLFGAYLILAVLGTTHRNLLLEDPIKLPIFNIDLPLITFYIIAPVFFVVFHFYFLIQLILLSRAAAALNRAVENPKLADETRNHFQMRVDNSVFIQLLAGAAPERRGANEWMIYSITRLTIIVAPIALLLLVELQFLPYHHSWMTWFHRIILTIDIALLLILWPINDRGEGLPSLALYAPPRNRRIIAKRITPLAVAILILLFSYSVAAFSTEGTYTRNPLTRLVFEGGVDVISGKPRGAFSNVLVLTDQKLYQRATSEKPERFNSLRGRDLRGAVLARADMRKGDFTGANLSGADLRDANLEFAKFGCALPAGPRSSSGIGGDECTNLEGAYLAGANLAGAYLSDANLTRARLNFADLTAAWLDRATLQETMLGNAVLLAASLRYAKLERAFLVGAQLQGADLSFATIERSDMRSAYVWAAQFDRVDTTSCSPDMQLQRTPLINLGRFGIGEEELKQELVERLINEMPVNIEDTGLKVELVRRLQVLKQRSRPEKESRDLDQFSRINSSFCTPENVNAVLHDMTRTFVCPAEDGYPDSGYLVIRALRLFDDMAGPDVGWNVRELMSDPGACPGAGRWMRWLDLRRP